MQFDSFYVQNSVLMLCQFVMTFIINNQLSRDSQNIKLNSKFDAFYFSSSINTLFCTFYLRFHELF